MEPEDADGGGELTRKVDGPVRGIPMVGVLPDFCGRCASDPASGCVGAGRCGVPAAERALCIAAADGTVGMLEAATLGALTGLNSWLFFRDRVVARDPANVPDLSGGRTGEPSREGLGDADADVDVERRGVVDARLRVGVVADEYSGLLEPISGPLGSLVVALDAESAASSFLDPSPVDVMAVKLQFEAHPARPDISGQGVVGALSCRGYFNGRGRLDWLRTSSVADNLVCQLSMQ